MMNDDQWMMDGWMMMHDGRMDDDIYTYTGEGANKAALAGEGVPVTAIKRLIGLNDLHHPAIKGKPCLPCLA